MKYYHSVVGNNIAVKLGEPTMSCTNGGRSFITVETGIGY